MTWNNIRAIDLLQSLPYVDAERIGSAGCSGGAQQTFYLMAVEDRLQAAVPVCMVSKFRTILDPEDVHCACNHVPGIAADTDTPEMAAVMAPRPSLIVTVTGDWTASFPEQDEPDLRAVYDLYDASSRLWTSHHESGHDYNQAMREETYRFMDRWLKGLADTDAAEREVPLPTIDELNALESRPEGEGMAAIAREFDRRRGPRYDYAQGLGGDGVADHYLRSQLIEWSRGLLQPPTEVSAGAVGQGELDGLTTRMLIIEVEPEFGVPAVLVESPSSGDSRPLVIAIHPDGKRAAWALARTELRRRVASGERVLLLDPRWMGECAAAGPAQTVEMNGIILGRPALVEGTRDVLAAVAWARSQRGVDPSGVSLMGWSDAGVLALMAGALDTRIASVDVRDLAATYAEGRSGPRAPHLLSVADLPHLAALIAPRELSLTGVAEPGEYSPTRDAFRAEGAADALLIEP
jgi:dienelactone hydrolase